MIDVRKIYSNKEGLTYVALNGVSVEIEEGDFVAIMGPSGSGKTTMLDLMGTLDTPTSGRIIINGKDTSSMNGNELAELRNSVIGFVFQSYNLVPYLSALDNVMLPSLVSGSGSKEKLQQAKDMLAEVGLGEKVNKRPNELSGGEQQRVAIVRAFINNPKILLSDEPTGNLDTKSAKNVLDILSRMCKENGTTVVLSTHDPEVGAFARRRIHIRDGLIEKEGSLAMKDISLHEARGNSDDHIKKRGKNG
ncbi:ABC transporter ATP-binding protein [Candidatus Marsarchaeota archaeon]|jgi:putative ABC transport system ATP-binding protein|nr:ABC transporter ATP-binding protein [Candidatus Marsarchaeota archaeon]